MYKYGFVKRVSSVVAGLFGKTRAKRRLNRDRIRYKGLISTVSETRLPRQKYAKKIPVAFCFDARGTKMAAVTIKSLLIASAGRCDYDIYCVVNADVTEELRDIVRGIVDGSGSTVNFVVGNNDFDESSRGKWPVAMWYRLMSNSCNPTDSSENGISQARILEWVAISFSRESLQPRDRT